MRTLKLTNFTWIDIDDPKESTIADLAKKYSFHHLAVEDSLTSLQRPKLDVYDNHLFLVFHMPFYVKSSARTVPTEINAFLGKDYLVTVHRGKVKPIDDLFSVAGKNSTLLTETPAHLLYELLNKVFNFCFPMLDRIAAKLDRIEDELYEDQSRRTLEEITVLERDIINFRRIINPQRYVVKDLENVKSAYVSGDLSVYFDDILDTLERIWDLLNSYKEVTEVLRSTNESILTQRLNEIIKVLTIFSVIMLPLTVITGFYGMNVAGLPIAGHPLASEIIIIFLIFVIGAMLTYFSKKKWL